MTQTDKRIEWKARFDAWKSSGFSVAEWCREQGVKEHQMYYWIQKFESDERSPEQVTPETQWLTVNVEDEPRNTTTREPVFIHFGAISVEVRPGVNMGLVSDIVHVLQSEC
ncbi:IS66 family insertion sequence element accessory protein TnpA [Virgibacillus sp. DJP39]|uniref:IS66 family insertion sequence element accessory protein TnpA n=1 Tax=Virgibacillus sp. DJP39 TaxID=3409790 RepID=UPI003BB75B27